MSSLVDRNSTSESDNTYVEITSGDQSGEVADVTTDKRLKVDSEVNFPSSQFPSVDYHLRLDDMNASNGGVARGTSISTSWTNIYSYTGSGHVFGFTVNPGSSNGVKFRLVVDGEEIFGANGLTNSDTYSTSGYDLLDVDVDLHIATIFVWNSSISWVFDYPIAYSSSVQIKMAAESGTEKFKAGLIKLTKY